MKRFWSIFVLLHTKIDIYFAELVAISVALQQYWEDFEKVLPPTWRHAIIGTAVAIIAINHILDAVRRVNGPKV